MAIVHNRLLLGTIDTVGRLDRWPVTAKDYILCNPLDFVLDFESTDRGRFRFEVSPMKPLDVVWVGLGGGLGSVLRWWIGRIVGEHFHGDFPLGTFLINISGSFAIGYLSTLFGVDWRDRYGTALSAGVLTGVLGGYTTFSTMQLDAAKLADRRGDVLAAFYLLLSAAVGLAAAALGVALARAQE
jgi:CrcB protein